MSLFDEIAAYQEANKGDKYQLISQDSPVWDNFQNKEPGVKYEVHEYSDGKGNTGWRLISRKTIDNKNYIKCENFGYESDQGFDWQQINFGQKGVMKNG